MEGKVVEHQPNRCVEVDCGPPRACSLDLENLVGGDCLGNPVMACGNCFAA